MPVVEITNNLSWHQRLWLPLPHTSNLSHVNLDNRWRHTHATLGSTLCSLWLMGFATWVGPQVLPLLVGKMGVGLAS